jgi:5-methylcytosine-specific restriction endonuclease McrA
MTYEQFQERVVAAGLTPRQCSPSHYQIIGGERIVNVWPKSPQGFKYQVNPHKAVIGNLASAIRSAGPHTTQPAKTPRPDARTSGEIKRQLYAKSQSCHYCDSGPMALADLCLDHMIPLSKGGAPGIENCTLACVPCNRAKADTMPDEFMANRPTTFHQEKYGDALEALAAKCDQLQRAIAERKAANEEDMKIINSCLHAAAVLREAAK